MRLILKDYLLQLKEKDELDLLLCDLLLQMGYTTDNTPETGNRQYGVDIRAHTDTELLLCVVKQGKITRKLWDSDPNAVRQSLEEIHDCYMNLIQGEDRKKQLRIAVVTNGMLDEAVRQSWEGYRRQNTVWDGIQVNIELWNIDWLTDSVQLYLFDERIFDDQMQSALRHALYFMEEDTYRRSYYEKIISTYLERLKQTSNPHQRKKILAGLHLASQMIAQYADKAQIYKRAVNVSEYLLLKYWDYLRCSNQMEENQEVLWIYKFLSDYLRWSKKYYDTVAPCCERKNGLHTHNPVSQRALIYEVLGYLVSYAYVLSFQYGEQAKIQCNKVVESIVQLLNNHAQYFYPAYDCDIGTVGLLYRLLLRKGRIEDVHTLIQAQCRTLVLHYQLSQKYPTPTDSFEDAVNIHMGFPAVPYETSAFWGTMLLWICVLEEKQLYEGLKQFLSEDMNEVTTCSWFLRAAEEPALYAPKTMYLAGEGFAVEIENTFEKFQSKVNFLLEQYEGEKFSFDDYSFPAMEFIICRYFGTLPRVKMEASEE